MMLYNRVLVTGANGLVGQEVVMRLSARPDMDVLATARDPEPRFSFSAGGYAPLDVLDFEAVRRMMQDYMPDAVVHLAAMTNVDACETDRSACWKMNVDATQHLADLCKLHGARMVHVSTDFIYSGLHPMYSEQARPDPVNYYGKSKLAAENAVRTTGSDRWAILRPALIFGSGTPNGRSNIVLWVLKNLQEGKRIRVVTDQWRTPTYAPDLAHGIERVIRYQKSGIYNMSGSDYLSIYDFALLIAHVFGLDASLIEPTDGSAFQQPAARPAKTGLIILKAETELGYKPLPLADALRQMGAHLGIPVY